MEKSAELIAVALHQISHDLHKLTEIVVRHAPLLDAYRSGGLLAMRAARKAARQDNGHFERRTPSDAWEPVSDKQAHDGGWGR